MFEEEEMIQVKVGFTCELNEQSAAALSTRHVGVALVEEVSSQGGWPEISITGEREDVRLWLLNEWDDDVEVVEDVLGDAVEVA